MEESFRQSHKTEFGFTLLFLFSHYLSFFFLYTEYKINRCNGKTHKEINKQR